MRTTSDPGAGAVRVILARGAGRRRRHARRQVQTPSNAPLGAPPRPSGEKLGPEPTEPPFGGGRGSSGEKLGIVARTPVAGAADPAARRGGSRPRAPRTAGAARRIPAAGAAGRCGAASPPAALGGVILVAAAMNGHILSGVVSFAVLSAIGVLSVLAGRFEAARRGRRHDEDERGTIVNTRAMSIAGTVLIIAITGCDAFTLARGERTSPYTALVAVGWDLPRRRIGGVAIRKLMSPAALPPPRSGSTCPKRGARPRPVPRRVRLTAYAIALTALRDSAGYGRSRSEARYRFQRALLRFRHECLKRDADYPPRAAQTPLPPSRGPAELRALRAPADRAMQGTWRYWRDAVDLSSWSGGRAATADHLMPVSIQEYRVAETGAGPYGITGGPDGALWFSLVHAGQIARRSVDGQLTVHQLEPATCSPSIIAPGPDNALWFTKSQGNRIGRITTAGEISSFDIPTPNSGPFGIVHGPDDAMWFTEMNANQIGRLTLDGEVGEYALPLPGAFPSTITRGPDNTLWFTMNQGNAIGQITPDENIEIYELPTPGAAPVGITNTSDGAWFVEIGAGQIGYISATGEIAEFPLPDRDARPHAIVCDEHGDCWFTEWAANRVGRIDHAGNIDEFELPTPDSEPHGITIGSNGAVWVALEIGALACLAPTA